MNNLGNWIAEQLITEQQIKTVIAIYPGRFQPMGPHHVKTYNWLAKKFGVANTFVVTSDKVKLPKSPLNFKEKESIINKHGIDNVVQVRNPYQSTELLKNYDPETTAAVFMVGEKDAQRLGGKFFRPWEGVANVGYKDGAYTLIAPHVSLKVMPFGEMSGTTLRQALADADPATFRNIMGFSDQKTRLMLIDKFKDLQQETIGNFLLKHPITEISLNSFGTNTDVDDGPRYFYGSQTAYEQSTKEMAESLGYSVIDYIMDGGMSDIDDTKWPKGPPLSVSYFPVGAAGETGAGTNYTKEMRGNPAYKEWSKYIQNIATQVGYKFLNFLGAEDSIESSQSEPLEKQPLVQEQIQNKKYWLNLFENITEASANTHLTHLEELLITQGAQGYKLAKSFLLELIRNLKGNSNAKVNTSVKWDGAPAIFTGINPDNGKFFVGTKSVFNKEPKINYTKEDIQRNHGQAPGLAKKLLEALEYFPSLGIKNILQGDFMFDKQSLKTQSIDGKPHYVFKPNTITYAVEADSDLGKRIARSKIGIVFHTTYKNLQSGASFGADVSGLRETPNVWFDDAFFKDTTGTVLLTNNEAKEVLNKIKQADSIKVNYNELPSALLNVYVNSEIKTNQFLENPEKSYQSFVEWTQGKIDKRIEKLKSVKGKERATLAGQEQQANIEFRKQDIINLFRVSKLFADAKMIFVNKYNSAIYKTKHFVDDGQGGLKVTAPEGYVAVDRIGNGVKLVDRLEFSRANFAMDKGFTK